jgi:hypothetical protein
MSKHPCWNIGASERALFGAVDTAIGEQFMCWQCAEGAGQPLTHESFHVITAHDIVDTGLWFKCDRCGDAIDEDILLGVEPVYSLPQKDMPEQDVERFMEETAATQYADHVAELKERERLDF